MYQECTSVIANNDAICAQKRQPTNIVCGLFYLLENLPTKNLCRSLILFLPIFLKVIVGNCSAQLKAVDDIFAPFFDKLLTEHQYFDILYTRNDSVRSCNKRLSGKRLKFGSKPVISFFYALLLLYLLFHANKNVLYTNVFQVFLP